MVCRHRGKGTRLFRVDDFCEKNCRVTYPVTTILIFISLELSILMSIIIFFFLLPLLDDYNSFVLQLHVLREDYDFLVFFRLQF